MPVERARWLSYLVYTFRTGAASLQARHAFTTHHSNPQPEACGHRVRTRGVEPIVPCLRDRQLFRL